MAIITTSSYAEMAVMLDEYAMKLAEKGQPNTHWYLMDRYERNRWRETARLLLVESQEYIKEQMG